MALIRMALVNGNVACRAIHFGRGCDQHAPRAKIPGGLEHIQRTLDICVHIGVRRIIAEGNGNQRGQVEHSRAPLYRLPNAVGIAYIPGKYLHMIHDGGGQRIQPPPGIKRIVKGEGPNLIALFRQMAADKTVRACDQHFRSHNVVSFPAGSF